MTGMNWDTWTESQACNQSTTATECDLFNNNEKNPIGIISSTLIEDLTEKKIDAELAITSWDKFSEETKMWAPIKHGDLETLFSDADYIITH